MSDNNDRTLRLNEEAISQVRTEVAAVVADIDKALDRLREVLETRMPDLRQEGPESTQEGVP